MSADMSIEAKTPPSLKQSDIKITDPFADTRAQVATEDRLWKENKQLKNEKKLLEDKLSTKMDRRGVVKGAARIGAAITGLGAVGAAAVVANEARQSPTMEISSPTTNTTEDRGTETSEGNHEVVIRTEYADIERRGIRLLFPIRDLENRTLPDQFTRSEDSSPILQVEYSLLDPNQSDQAYLKAADGKIDEEATQNVRRILVDGKPTFLQMVAFPTIERPRATLQMTESRNQGKYEKDINNTIPYNIDFDISIPNLPDKTEIVRAYAEKDSKTGETVVDPNILLKMHNKAKLFDKFALDDPDRSPTRVYVYDMGEMATQPSDTFSEYSLPEADLSDYYNARDGRVVVPLEHIKDGLWELVLYDQLARRIKPLNEEAQYAFDDIKHVYGVMEEYSVSETNELRSDDGGVSIVQNDPFFKLFDITTYRDDLKDKFFFQHVNPAFNAENLHVGALMVLNFVEPEELSTRLNGLESLDATRADFARKVFAHEFRMLRLNNSSQTDLQELVNNTDFSHSTS